MSRMSRRVMSRMSRSRTMRSSSDLGLFSVDL